MSHSIKSKVFRKYINFSLMAKCLCGRFPWPADRSLDTPAKPGFYKSKLGDLGSSERLNSSLE